MKELNAFAVNYDSKTSFNKVHSVFQCFIDDFEQVLSLKHTPV